MSFERRPANKQFAIPIPRPSVKPPEQDAVDQGPFVSGLYACGDKPHRPSGICQSFETTHKFLLMMPLGPNNRSIDRAWVDEAAREQV